ncbi:hypothetical protein BY996DRAFT_6559079, partial [Phakopsora pachyrhizi]
MESGINKLNVSRKALMMSQAKLADALSASSDAATSWSSRFAPGINPVEVAVRAVPENQATITLLSSLKEAQAGTGLRGIDQPAVSVFANPYLIGTSCLPDQFNLRKTDSNRLNKEPCLSPFSVTGVDNQTSTNDLRSSKADSYYNSFTNPSSSSNCNPPPGGCNKPPLATSKELSMVSHLNKLPLGIIEHQLSQAVCPLQRILQDHHAISHSKSAQIPISTPTVLFTNKQLFKHFSLVDTLNKTVTGRT